MDDGAVTGDDLLLELAVRPFDANLRAAWVDWLLEQGSTAGEYARLVRTGQQADAEALWRAEGDRWLSPELRRHAVPGSARFRDGLLESVALKPMTEDDARRLALDPVWTFVRAVTAAPTPVVQAATGLEDVHLGLDALEELAGWSHVLPRLRRLSVELHAVTRLGALLSQVTPAVEHLVLHPLVVAMNPRQFVPLAPECCAECAEPPPLTPSPFFDPAPWRAFFTEPLACGLRRIDVTGGFMNLEDWSAFLESTRCDVESFGVLAAQAEQVDGPAQWHVDLERTGPGRYRRVRVRDWGRARPDRDDVQAVLGTCSARLELVRG
jgi:hypothetical protein